MKLSHTALFLVAGLAAMAAAQQTSPSSPALTPATLLQRSYNVVQGVPAQERLWLMMRLADSWNIDPQLAGKWAEELFQLGQEADKPQGRGSAEVRAVEDLANVNVERALQLFRRMHSDMLAAKLGPPVESRGAAAYGLFQTLIRKNGLSALPIVQQEAQRLREDGMYPYAAIGGVVRQISGMDKNAAQSLFNDALAAYEHAAAAPSGDAAFVGFVEIAWEAVPRTIAQKATSVVVNRLLNQKPERGESGFPMQVDTGHGKVKVENSADLQMSSLLGILSELDPALLKQIAQRRPSLAKAALQASAPRKPQPKPAGRTPSRAQVETTPCGNSVSDSDIVVLPDQARGPAARLAAEAMASKDPQRARQLLDEAETSVDRINDKSEALDEIVFVASAAHRLQRQESLRRLLDRSFALGDELTRMEQSQGPVYTPRAWVPLTSAVRLGMHSEPELTISDIEAIRSPALKALLLVDAARSLPRK